MSTRGLKKWALLLAFWMALQLTRVKAQDLNVAGNLTVTGTTTLKNSVDIQGNTVSAGVRTDTSDAGWGMIYTDGTTSTLEFDATRSSHIWKWQQNAGATLQLQMTLDNNNNLTLFDQSSPANPNIVLSPTGTSTFANSLLLNGTDNEMPNQQLLNANSILTQGLGDGRYLSSSTTSASLQGDGNQVSFLVGGAFAVNSNSSSYSNGRGYYYDAYDNYDLNQWSSGGNQATGGNSLVVGGNNTASGMDSVAIGNRSTASGVGSMAIGYQTTASGGCSFASGLESTASGYGSTASGYHTVASSPYSFAIGQYNGLNPTNSGLGSPVFEVGNGDTSASTYVVYPNWDPNYAAGQNGTGPAGYQTWGPSDAFAVFSNGNAFVQGTMTVQGFPMGGINPTDPIFTVTNGSGPGPTTVGGYYDYYWSSGNLTNAFVVYNNGNATLQGGLVATGTDTELPHQTLVNGSSVLTEALADARYLPAGSGGGSDVVVESTIGGGSGVAVSINSGSATGNQSLASGIGSTASGNYSLALGQGDTASSNSSVALGKYTVASNCETLALGYSTVASCNDAVAMGNYSVASGWDSIASGHGSVSSAWCSTSMGLNTTASGTTAVALGNATTSSGLYSLATGNSTLANGTSAVSMGSSTSAVGDNTVAMGEFSTGQAYDSLVIGCCNANLNEDGVTATTPNLWVPTDPVFEVGNGNGYYTPDGYNPTPSYSDAFVVYKNGDTAVQGNLTSASVSSTGTITGGAIASTGTVTAAAVVVTAPSGDIPMYSGN